MAGWLPSWKVRKRHKILAATGAGANYPVLVRVHKKAWAEKAFTDHAVLGSFTDTPGRISQGAATDGTHVYVSYDGGGNELIEKRKKTGEKVASTDQQNTKHISSIKVRNNIVYAVDCQDWVNLQPHANAKTQVVEFNAGDLSYRGIKHTDLANHWGEDVFWYDGKWWMVFHCCSIIRTYDIDWNFLAEYDIVGHGATEQDWNNGNGYNGMLIWVQGGKVYFGLAVHGNVTGGPALYIFEYANDAFTLVKTVSTSLNALGFIPNQGCDAEKSDGTSCWFADRVHYKVVNARVDYLISTTSDYKEDVYLATCKDDFGDIRFTKNDGSTLLKYWLEEKLDTDYAVFWVKIEDNLEVESRDIFLYYENAAATYNGNGEDVFSFFDDFPGSALDLTKWTPNAVGTITYTVSGSKIRITDCTKSGTDWWIYNNTDSGNQHQSKWTLLTSFAIRWLQEAHDDSPLQYTEVGLALVGADNLLAAYKCHFDSKGDLELCKRDKCDFVEATGKTSYVAVTPPDKRTFEIRKYGTAVVCRDVTDEVDVVSGTSTDVSKVAIAVGAIGGFSFVPYVDIFHVAIRKYTSPEPAHGDWQPSPSPPTTRVGKNLAKVGTIFLLYKPSSGSTDAFGNPIRTYDCVGDGYAAVETMTEGERFLVPGITEKADGVGIFESTVNVAQGDRVEFVNVGTFQVLYVRKLVKGSTVYHIETALKRLEV